MKPAQRCLATEKGRARPFESYVPPHSRRPTLSNNSPTLRQRFEQHCLQSSETMVSVGCRHLKRQCRLKKSLTICPEMMFANDNLIAGAVVAGAALATATVPGDGVCMAATSFTCLLIAVDRFFSTSTAFGPGAVGACACTGGGGSSGTASPNSVGDGTMVGRLVSMTIRSGDCCIDAMRMTGLLVSSAVPSAKDCGRNQFATSSNASSNVPTQAMYRPIGITVSADQFDASKRRNS